MPRRHGRVLGMLHFPIAFFCFLILGYLPFGGTVESILITQAMWPESAPSLEWQWSLPFRHDESSPFSDKVYRNQTSGNFNELLDEIRKDHVVNATGSAWLEDIDCVQQLQRATHADSRLVVDSQIP